MVISQNKTLCMKDQTGSQHKHVINITEVLFRVV